MRPIVTLCPQGVQYTAIEHTVKVIHAIITPAHIVHHDEVAHRHLEDSVVEALLLNISGMPYRCKIVEEIVVA